MCFCDSERILCDRISSNSGWRTGRQGYIPNNCRIHDPYMRSCISLFVRHFLSPPRIICIVNQIENSHGLINVIQSEQIRCGSLGEVKTRYLLSSLTFPEHCYLNQGGDPVPIGRYEYHFMHNWYNYF